MKILFFVFFVSINCFANPVPLPNVHQEAKKVLDSMKEYNPIADCISPSMFSSQSPLQSSKQIGNCVSIKIKNLDLPESSEMKEKMHDINADGHKIYNNLKHCWQSFEALKNCLPDKP
jgi:hypothetical protein